jgi:hypothetical protein
MKIPDTMDDQVMNKLIDFITAKEHNWTIIIKTPTGNQEMQQAS